MEAAGDAVIGMRQRGIALDTWAFNVLLQSCSTACDLVREREGGGKGGEGHVSYLANLTW